MLASFILEYKKVQKRKVWRRKGGERLRTLFFFSVYHPEKVNRVLHDEYVNRVLNFDQLLCWGASVSGSNVFEGGARSEVI